MRDKNFAYYTLIIASLRTLIGIIFGAGLMFLEFRTANSVIIRLCWY